MTREEEIRARCDAATPGPWILIKDGRYEDHDECRIELPDDIIEFCRYENGEFAAHAHTDIPYLLDENARLARWVSDLQSGMYVNCVYCGHRYGPSETTPVSMADALKTHVETCPKHPMSALKAENARLRAELEAAKRDIKLMLSANQVCGMCWRTGADSHCEKDIYGHCDAEWRGGPSAENGGTK